MGSALNGDEREMKRRLDILMKKVEILHFVMAKVDKSITEITNQQNYHKKMMNNNQLQMNLMQNEETLFMQNPKNIKTIFNFLTDQTKIISHLTKTVQKDFEDLDVIQNGIFSA